MPLMATRNAGFNSNVERQFPIGFKTSIDTVSRTTYTFAFSSVYAGAKGTDTGSGNIVYTSDVSTSINLDQAAPSRAILVQIAGQSTTGRSISSVTAQVTSPSSGDSVTLTAIQDSGSSQAPCGIFVGRLPPVGTDAETITITVTFSGAVSQGCCASLLVLPSINSLTPIDSGQNTASPFVLTLGIRPNAHVVSLANCYGASVTGYIWSVSAHSSRNTGSTDLGGGVTELSIEGIQQSNVDQALSSRYAAFGTWSPIVCRALTTDFTVNISGTPSTPRFFMAASFL